MIKYQINNNFMIVTQILKKIQLKMILIPKSIMKTVERKINKNFYLIIIKRKIVKINYNKTKKDSLNLICQKKDY